MRKWNLLFIAISTFLLFPACENGNTYGYDHDRWDTNNDGLINVTEFEAAFYEIGVYDEWDIDGDGLLDAGEWEAGIAAYDGPEGFGTFDDWDLNDDDYLSREELIAGLFQRWDIDNDDYISENEFEGSLG